MTQPATEGDTLLNAEGSHEFFKVVVFRAIANNRKMREIGPQKRSSRSQTYIARLSAYQTADKNQLQLGATFWLVNFSLTKGASNTVFRDKKQLIVMGSKFGAHVRRSGYDCGCMTICRPGKRNIAVQLSYPKVEALLVVRLAEPRSRSQPAV